MIYAHDNKKGITTDDYLEISLPEGAASSENFGKLITEFQVISDVHIQADKEFWLNGFHYVF